MVTKKYSSYKEIDLELEILKLQKELSYQKVVLNTQKIKESFKPLRIVSEIIGSYRSLFSNSYKTVLQSLIPIIIKFLSNKKRGD